MATVNIANNTWQTQQQTPTINITASSTYVEFNMGYELTNEMCCAKACIAINASNYKTITLQFGSVTTEGISSLHFGVFDNMTAQYYWNSEYDNGISPSSLSGADVTEITPDSNKTITIDISGVTGTKYVGFLFYGNTCAFNEYVGWGVVQKVDITSLTAVESGYKLIYDANGGSGAPDLVSNVMSTAISGIVPIRSGYNFLGWSTSPSAISASYVAGNFISLSSDTRLYAVWRRVGLVYIYDSTGGFNPYQVLIYDGYGWNQYVPYIYTESGWVEYSG